MNFFPRSYLLKDWLLAFFFLVVLVNEMYVQCNVIFSSDALAVILKLIVISGSYYISFCAA